ncbi:MAG: hypothetical protein IPI48_15850 [bacterium]|nr:hypothetical protein [bacterium]
MARRTHAGAKQAAGHARDSTAGHGAADDDGHVTGLLAAQPRECRTHQATEKRADHEPGSSARLAAFGGARSPLLHARNLAEDHRHAPAVLGVRRQPKRVAGDGAGKTLELLAREQRQAQHAAAAQRPQERVQARGFGGIGGC